MEKYPEIQKIYDDIKKLNIQGATNVAISTLEGMKKYLEVTKEIDPQLLYTEILEVGKYLGHARPNEPLAVNGVTYVKHRFTEKKSVLPKIETMKQELEKICNDYLELLEHCKRELVDYGTRNLFNFDKLLTHCHSSTAVALIKSLGKGDHDFETFCTETRPLFQGRKTAKSLVDGGIKTTLIADSAAESFVIGRGSSPIDAIFIGCDQITPKGHAINKIGSWGIAMAAHYVGKPVYVVTPMLKLDNDSGENIEIEVRESRELWEDAPNGLIMYNPAFEIVDNLLITGYVTEVGIIKPQDLEKEAKSRYPWLFENSNI